VNSFYSSERAAYVRQDEFLDEAQRERLARHIANSSAPRRPRIRVGRLLVEFGIRLSGALRPASPRRTA
jgi:hypothetical protein